jgi:hypothetical protein
LLAVEITSPAVRRMLNGQPVHTPSVEQVFESRAVQATRVADTLSAAGPRHVTPVASEALGIVRVSHQDDPDGQGIRLGSSHTLETDARGVRIRNPWSQYDIPWAAVRGIEIVESDRSQYLSFTVDSDANPGGPKAANPDGRGRYTAYPGRFVAVRVHCTETFDVGRLEDLRRRILAARDAALAEHSGEGGAVKVRGAPLILWNFPRTRVVLTVIGSFVLLLVSLILVVMGLGLGG